MSRDSIREAIAGLYVNHVGQEGRGAAESVRSEALRVVEEQWAAEDAEEARRLDLLRALRAEMATAVGRIGGVNAPDYLADQLTGSLSMFVLSVDAHTWTPPDPDPATPLIHQDGNALSSSESARHG